MHYVRQQRHGDPLVVKKVRDVPLVDRLWAKVRKGGPDDCWEWQGATLPKGYGVIGLPGRGSGNVLAHRVAYESVHGPISEGMHVLHSCDNPPCCNPAHLSLGTNSDNVADMVAKGRHRPYFSRAERLKRVG